VVSLPCFELFDEQPQSFQDEVLPPHVTARVAVEAGVRQGWDRYLAGRGAFVGMHGFGMSAPYEEIFQAVGITSKKVAAVAKRLLGK
jgi:transketolase